MIEAVAYLPAVSLWLMSPANKVATVILIALAVLALGYWLWWVSTGSIVEIDVVGYLATA